MIFINYAPLRENAKVHPLIIRRYGFPFMVGKMKRHKSFCLECFVLLGFSFSYPGGSGESMYEENRIIAKKACFVL